MQDIKHKFGRFLKGSKSQPKGAATISGNDSRSRNIRQRADRFRVLIIGRANAGKTTILQKVCNTVEQPEIFNSKGEKIDTSVVSPTVLRGMHNIENELVFRSNTGFIFHDSRGFEAGGVAELNTVKKFIASRSKTTQLKTQLHVIWYCIPMDDERPFTAAERSFFSECGTGSVPVVAIFTKFDALEDVAYGKLKNEGVSREDAIMQAPARAVSDFESMYLSELYQRKYPPKGHVYLRDMNKPETDCHELTETVVAVLGDGHLQQLFVSTQRNNLELCMKLAVERALTPAITEAQQLMRTIPTEFQERMVPWYPHFATVPPRPRRHLHLRRPLPRRPRRPRPLEQTN